MIGSDTCASRVGELLLELGTAGSSEARQSQQQNFYAHGGVTGAWRRMSERRNERIMDDEGVEPGLQRIDSINSNARVTVHTFNSSYLNVLDVV